VKQGFGAAIRRYIAAQQAQLHTEAIVVAASDVRQTHAQFSAGSLSNATAVYEDAVRLSRTDAATISHTSGTDNLTSLPVWTSGASFPLAVWALDEGALGPQVRLAKVGAYLDLQPNGGQPRFDGYFALTLYRIPSYRVRGSVDEWALQKVADSVIVAASTIGATPALVEFTFSDSVFGGTPRAIEIGPEFSPRNELHVSQGLPHVQFTGRVIAAQITAYGGTNSNVAWKYDSGQANPKAVGGAGSLYHFATVPGPANLLLRRQVTLGTGMPRVTFTTGTYAVSGSVTFAGGVTMDLGAVPSGVEFRVSATVPAGASGTAEARVGSGDPWVAVADGQTPAEVGLASSQTYEMRYSMSADATRTASPALYALGVVDRVLLDLTPYATWDGVDESVDPLTGRVKMDAATCRLEFVGVRDFRDDVTRLLSAYNWTGIELRTHAWHPTLARSAWGLLDLWRLDEAEVGESSAALSCVSILAELEGRYPRATGTETGYLVKSTASDLTVLGGDFQRVLSAGTQTPGSVVWTVSGSATEFAYLATPAAVPNLRRWPTGAWRVLVNVTSGNANIYLACRIKRVTAAGTVQETEPAASYATTEEVQATAGLKTFAFGGLEWTEGLTTDRLVVELRARNADAGNQSITIETGTASTETRAPWTATAAMAPQSFSAVYPKDAYVTWRDTVIGLPARYRGPRWDVSPWRVSKEIMDADGRRELERLAWLDGFAVIASQGVVKPVDLTGTRNVAAAAFPLEQTRQESVTMGFASRLPEYVVPFGYNTSLPDTFAGEVRVRHAAALTAYAGNRVNAPDPRIEDEVAKYVLEPGLASALAQRVVAALAVGRIVIEIVPTEWYPWLEIGDAVAVETTRLAFRDPASGDAFAGPVWAFGVIVGRGGPALRPSFAVWVPGLAGLFAAQGSVDRRVPYEGPAVELTVGQDPTNLGNAVVRVRAFPPASTIRYVYHDLGVAPPDRAAIEQWSGYSQAVTVPRHESDDRLFSAFAAYQGFAGPIQTVRIAPDEQADLGGIVVAESGSSPNIALTAAGLDVDGDTRTIRWYGRKGAWPALAAGQSAVITCDALKPFKASCIRAWR